MLSVYHLGDSFVNSVTRVNTDKEMIQALLSSVEKYTEAYLGALQS